jgi:hypothetical protein
VHLDLSEPSISKEALDTLLIGATTTLDLLE